MKITIYTDASYDCHKTRKSGWGGVIRKGRKVETYCRAFNSNYGKIHIMEKASIINMLHIASKQYAGASVDIYSDCANTVNNIGKRHGVMDKKFKELVQKFNVVRIKHIKAHKTIDNIHYLGNSMADRLAIKARKGL